MTAAAAPEVFADTLSLVLRTPINLGGVEYAALELSEPTTKQLRQADKAGSALDQLAVLISVNAQVPMAVVDAIGQRDLGRAGDFFAHFGVQQATSTS